jgi:hypothetical protein
LLVSLLPGVISIVLDVLGIDVVFLDTGIRILPHIYCIDPDPSLLVTSARCIVIRELFCVSCTQDGLPVPMSLAIFVEWCKHNREDNLDVVTHQTAEILIIP